MTSNTTLPSDYWWKKHLNRGLNELQHELIKVLDSCRLDDAAEASLKAAEASLKFDDLEQRLETTLLMFRQVQGVGLNA